MVGEYGSVWMTLLWIRTQFYDLQIVCKHKKSNIMTGNECRNWKASTLKRHTHSADHSLLLQRLWLGPFQFLVCLMRKQRVMQPYFVHWTSNTQLTNVWSSTNEIRRVSTFVSIRYPFTLLIDLNQFIDNKWLLNSLHLKISRVFYNDITKKTCMVPDARSKPLHFPA